MAYSSIAEVQQQAGGAAALVELAHDEDGELDEDIVAYAQLEADAWIDSVTRRIQGAAIPWDTAIAPIIGTIAAAETVYILRQQHGVATERHDAAHERRRQIIEGVAAGNVLPSSSDPYPIGEGGGAPIAVERTSSSSAGGPLSRDDMKGFA